jgi:hypothetical protein
VILRICLCHELTGILLMMGYILTIHLGNCQPSEQGRGDETGESEISPRSQNASID